jgi:DNA/RNA-binding domain of Phe-tRNA-synthetase-like protein
MTLPPIRSGAVAAEVADDFPGLRLRFVVVPAEGGKVPPELTDGLRALSARHRGSTAVAMRTQPIHAAYRTFFRQVGLDPDLQRPPAEQAAVDRLLHGGFTASDRISAACLLALVDTAVPVWALDAAIVDAQTFGIGLASNAGPPISRHGEYIEPGSLVVSDAGAVHALLFGPPLRDHGAARRTRSLLLYSIAVAGVWDPHIDEALDIAAGWLVADP